MTNLHVHATFTSAVHLQNTDRQTAQAMREREKPAKMGQAFALLQLVLNEQTHCSRVALEWFEKESPA